MVDQELVAGNNQLPFQVKTCIFEGVVIVVNQAPRKLLKAQGTTKAHRWVIACIQLPFQEPLGKVQLISMERRIGAVF